MKLKYSIVRRKSFFSVTKTQVYYKVNSGNKNCSHTTFEKQKTKKIKHFVCGAWCYRMRPMNLNLFIYLFFIWVGYMTMKFDYITRNINNFLRNAHFINLEEIFGGN